MDSCRIYLILVFLVICQGRPAEAGGGIKFGFNSSNAPPLLFQFDNQNNPIPTGGLIYEVSVAIGEELGGEYSIARIPRKRIATNIINNKIDLICHNSLRWRHPFADGALWSKPLFTHTNVLVGLTAIPFTSAEQIKGSIGTVENYVYADLEERFKTLELLRNDSPNIEVSVKKLLTGRVPYILLSDLEYTYFKSQYPRLQRSTFAMDKTDIQCSLSKKSTLTLARLNRAIERLHEKQIFAKIIKRYSDPDTTPKPVTYGLNSNDSPPFIHFDKTSSSEGIVRGGVFFDIALEIGKRIQRPINFVLLPRGRLDARLASGQIELVCYDTEAWAGEYAKQYHWSTPIFRQSDFIVGHKGDAEIARIRTLEDLKGKRIGAVLNFVYPALTPFFEGKSLQREDAGSGAANVEKLSVNRVPLILLNSLEYSYYKSKDSRLQKAPLEIDPVDVKCALSKKSTLKIEEINSAIHDLEKSGRMRKIFAPSYLL
ncbi:substrate-binding periplasmic protein [Bdellovibrio bacteriovorus]|uniref:substrate-binding periplasmic protein n=1 Tax=Bdellovibrio bacteriovorus TaxID=959 RepID=UPI003AA89DA4